MIEKLKEHDIIDPKTDKVIGKIGCDLREIMDKLNELVDAVNVLQESMDLVQSTLVAEPEKCESPSENMLTKSLRMDKEFAEDECARLQDELERTRKALDVAVDALDRMAIDDNVSGMIARNAIKEIKALEQKEG